ncbi:MAG: hypothetical protein DHS20C14_17850 [Phycisphaeraceae bacterium]|nr:MAG: hypothetical protein DHS20C14_17850 [Phycisphaeraceae bacterium]
MRHADPLTLMFAAGACLASPALAHPARPVSTAGEVPAIGKPAMTNPGPLRGHLYIHAGSGEVVFTPAEEYIANRARQRGRALWDDLTGDGVEDYFLAINTDPCPIGTPTSPNTTVAAVDNPTTQGDYHLYKAQIDTPDMLIGSLQISFWTDITDTDLDSDTIPDGNTGGHGIEISFWDREDYFGKSCSFCGLSGGPGYQRERVTTLQLTNLPGPLTPPAPGEMSGFIVTVDLSGGSEFELADSNGVGPASGLFNSMIAANDIDTDSDTSNGFEATSADTDSNGQIDFSYSFHAIQPNDRPPGHIGYQLAAPGIPGTPGIIDGTTGLPVSGPVGADDGVIDYGNRDDGTPPLQWSHTRILLDSINAPMGRNSFPFTSGLLPVPSTIARFSWFFASLGEQPDPDGPPPISPLYCPGEPNSDTFGWGAVHPPNGEFYGDLNCEIDDDGDTVPDGRPWSSAYLALSGALPQPCGIADLDGNGVLNIDDIDLFVSYFIGGDLRANCDGGGGLNIDDIDCFVAAFLSGCP